MKTRVASGGGGVSMTEVDLPHVARRFEGAQFDRPFIRLAGATMEPHGNHQLDAGILRGQSSDMPQTDLYETPMEFSVDPFCLSSPVGVDPAIPFADLVVDIQSDHHFFYSRENVRPTLAFLGVSAAMAYSNWDAQILDFTQTALPSTSNSRLFRAFRTVGNGYAMLPVYAGSALAGKYLQLGGPEMATIGEWGDRTVRGILVGTPPLLVSQFVLGGSRPDESAHRSRWDYFEDTNAVSGHAFMGAVPFLTAYQMAETTRSKIFWLSLSMIPAVSRIADNAHYPSQSLLGWGLAYLATSSVARTELSHCTFVMVPSVDGRQCGMTLMIRR